MMCRDGKPCDTYFGADGSLFCRHGLVSEATQSTAVNWKCPLEGQWQSEKDKWGRFMKDFPEIMNSLTVEGKQSQ